jgi:hypothetical protein
MTRTKKNGIAPQLNKYPRIIDIKIRTPPAVLSALPVVLLKN